MNAYPERPAENLRVLGNYHYNVYLVLGRHSSALVEVGVSAVVDEVIRQLDLLEARPDLLVLTHPHADHLTGLGGLQERYPDARVVAAPGAKEFAEHPKAVENLAAEDRHMHEIMAATGHPPGRQPANGPPTLNEVRIAEEGDRIDLGGATLCFLEAKGHSPGHVAVHIPEYKAAIVSDALGFYFPRRGFWPMFFTDYTDYLATLRRLEALQPEILGLGHQGFVAGEDVSKALEEATVAAEDFLTTVRRNDSSDEELADRLFRQCYRDELVINSEGNIRNCMKLLIKRCREVEE